jgi:hypothetical protein
MIPDTMTYRAVWIRKHPPKILDDRQARPWAAGEEAPCPVGERNLLRYSMVSEV